MALPTEINLPAHARIFEPKTENFNPLCYEEVKDRIIDAEIADNLQSTPTLVIINDHHRATPSHVVLRILSELLPENQINDVIIACGTHDPPNEEQIRSIIKGNVKRLNANLVIHHQDVDFIHYGTTSRGTEVLLNPIIEKYDQILCINSVEPHYFAGFTGGIKSIIPGLAKVKSVEKNHSWALSEKAQPTKVWDNPLQLDLWEAATKIDKNLLGIQMVSVGDNIFDLHIGKLKAAYKHAIDTSKEMFSYLIDDKMDIIVSIIYPPLDDNLYQAQKGIENTQSVLADGGEMILVAKCEGGIGNTAFFETMKKFDKPSDVLSSLSHETYNFGDHKAYKFAHLANRAKITLATDLTIKQCNNVFADKIYIDSLESHLNKIGGQNKKIAIVIDSGMVVLHT